MSNLTAQERNKHLRELANEISASVSKVIGLSHAPKCLRITPRRGHGRVDGFSVPVWAANVTDYFIYYVAHEVCHATGEYGHGPKFRENELKALAHLGLKPIYERAGKGPYVEELQTLSGKTLVLKAPKAYPVAA